MVQDTKTDAIPEELYNLTQLAEVTLAAGRLSTTNVSKITEYINKEKSKQIKFRRRYTMQDNWNRNIEDMCQDIVLSSANNDEHSVIKRNHHASTRFVTDRTNFHSSSDDDSNYYSHKIFDRKKSRRSTISDNSRYDELSCSSLPSSGDEHTSSSKMLLEHGGDDEHVCPECGKKYSTSSNLARHRQTHRSILDKKARRCPHCEKVYVSMPAYSMHVRTHNQGCKCPHCGKCFSRPWLLQGHIRTHTGEKPFKCEICSKAFADKSNLRAHIQTHSNTKPHACSRCGKAFALKSYLYKHEESSCMRNHVKQEKDRARTPKSDTTKSNLMSKLLKKDGQNQELSSPTSTTWDFGLPPSESEVITEELTQKSYTTLTSSISQNEFDRFTRISVIRTPVTNQDYEPNGLQLNCYQENPVDFSPKNNFSHSIKTSPFELTGSYAIVA